MSLAPGQTLHGARNFRAVKPYRAADGRHLRRDMVFRSGELSRLTEADLEVVSRLGIRLVCDLRSDREQAEFVSLWPAGSAHRRLALPDREATDAGPHRFFELITSHPGETGAVMAMDRLYRRKPRTYAEGLALLFEAILAGGALPLLIHCHAGKDRTGFIVAMLLAATGISAEDIMDDYLTTARYFPMREEAAYLAGWALRAFGQVIDPLAAMPMVDARPEYLDAAFEQITRGWGGVDLYLQNAVGLTVAKRDALRDLVLV